MLILQRLARHAAPGADLVGQLHHLIDRLLAVEPHHEFFDVLPQLLAALRGRRGREDLDHHRNHHFGPALADQRQGAVKIKQDRAASPPRQVGVEDLDARAGEKRRGRERHGDLRCVFLG
jgi:hypothetical protein